MYNAFDIYSYFKFNVCIYNVYLATAVPVNCISCEAVQKDGGQLLYKMYFMYKPYFM